MSFKIHLKDGSYTEWEIYNSEDNKLIELDINPIEKKILSGDLIDCSGNILDSTIRNTKNLAGILILKGKTYGRSKQGSGKFYYKCIPNDKRLPAFLIPYEEKQSSFSKAVLNKYILFKYNNWETKHPVGTLNNVIGDINNLSAFYEYQLHCKDLVKPFKEFTQAVNRANKQYGKNIYQNLMENHSNIIDRRDDYIISIDPVGSTDLDDAFSLKDDILSIYVANVPILLDYFNLWNSFSERISTIYLPDRKCPMLPTLLSEKLCSLIQNDERIAFCIDLKLEDYKIINIEFNNVLIKVSKNYIYNEENLNNDYTYNSVFNIVNKLNKNYKYMREISDSHDIVSYLMLLMNAKCADKLQTFKTGIYRTVKLKENNLIQPDNIPSEIYNFIKIWQTSSGQYSNFKENIGHQLIHSGLDNYVHITSPIRRLVDLLNMLKLQDKLGLIKYSEKSSSFYNYWENQLEYINTTTRAIRKIQTDCSILNMCVSDKSILETIYDGYLFDRIERPNKLHQYTVYISSIKIFTRVNLQYMYSNFSCCKFKLYLIEDGITLKRKIRAEIVN